MPADSPITPLSIALAREASDVAGGADAAVSLEPPANAQFGDLATNVAMTLAKAAKRAPRDIAEELVQRIPGADGLAGYVGKAEVACAGHDGGGPGIRIDRTDGQAMPGGHWRDHRGASARRLPF